MRTLPRPSHHRLFPGYNTHQNPIHHATEEVEEEAAAEAIVATVRSHRRQGGERGRGEKGGEADLAARCTLMMMMIM